MLKLPKGAAAFVCAAPPIFLEDFTAGLGGWGVARDRVHSELFGSGEPITPGVRKVPRRLPHAPPGSPGNGCSGVVVQGRFLTSKLSLRH
jgi:hypothetical protein